MARATGSRTMLAKLNMPIPQDADNNWWRYKSVTERNQYMLQHAIDTDVTFIFHHSKIIPTDNEEQLMSAADERNTKRQPRLQQRDASDDEEFLDCQTTQEAASHKHHTPREAQQNMSDIIQVTDHTKAAVTGDSESDVLASSVATVTADVTVDAHRFMLLSASSVLCKMIHEHGDRDDDIVITDVQPEIFRIMLRYIYTDSTVLDEQTVIPLLSASRLYDMPALSTLCTDWLAKQVNTTNACLLLEKSLELKQDKLCRQCLQVINSNTTGALEADGFSEISEQTLSYILSSDTLSIAEVTLFHYCSVWATLQLEKRAIEVTGPAIRDQLGPALYKLRLPSLTLNDFSTIIVPTDILSKEEELAIFRYLSMPSGSGDDSIKNTPFALYKRGGSRAESMTAKPSVTISSVASPETGIPVPAQTASPNDTFICGANPAQEAIAHRLLLSEAFVNEVKVLQCTPPTVFTLNLSAPTCAILVNGVRFSSPILSQSSSSDDKPVISILNLTNQQKLLYRFPIDIKETKYNDGLAYHEVLIQPFWLLPREAIPLQLQYDHISASHTNTSHMNTFVNRVFGSSSKIRKSSHVSYGLQVVSGRSVLGGQEKVIHVDSTPSSPLLAISYQIT